MKERRRFKRFSIEGMEVKCKMFFVTEVEVLNISVGGVALSLNKRLNMGEEYTLNIESESNAISLKGVVVWEKMTSPASNVRGGKMPVYEVGMRFEEVLTGKGAALLNFISDNISGKAIKTRIQGFRVKILQPGKTVLLDDRDSYAVKMIGLGGMLIEGKEALDTEGRFLMEMNFAEEMKPIRFHGRIAYCREIPGKIPQRYETGIEFVQMDEKDSSRLKEFIDILQTI
jgi:hypothetical protein